MANSGKASKPRSSVADTKLVSKSAVEEIGVWAGIFGGVAVGVALPLADMRASKDFSTQGVDGGSGAEIGEIWDFGELCEVVHWFLRNLDEGGSLGGFWKI